MASDGPTENSSNRTDKGTRRSLSFEARIRIYCLIFGLPTVVLCIVLVWKSSFSTQVMVVGGVVLALLLLSSLLLEEVVRPLQTMSNVVSSLRERDYSFRSRGANRSDALGELSSEINELANMLQSQRLSELETTALLRRVIDSMDAPVLAFDQGRQLQLMNPAAERILFLDAGRDVGRDANQLELDHLIDAPDEGLIGLRGASESPNSALRKSGRWMVRRSEFRQRGVPNVLVLLSDVSSALREEERVAWQRLIRVLGHEINNSLAPIKSIAGSLRARLPQEAAAANGAGDFVRGLTIIEGRAESLNRFVQAYRQLAQLPAPVMRPISLQALLGRVVALETRMSVALGEIPEIEVVADPDQFEQLLINLVKNAVEAVLIAHEEGVGPQLEKTGSAVTVSAIELPDAISISVEDSGLGLSNTSNLFVPFYTTKKDGSGVGLALVRQIAEAHGGSVSLRNREDAPGCVAEVKLPLARSTLSA
jgi:two-component system, NtrC family, nitrogen regulation sensor histidine kinase NtrY